MGEIVEVAWLLEVQRVVAARLWLNVEVVLVLMVLEILAFGFA